MKMSYLSCVVTLSLLVSAVVSAADWEQSQNKLAVSGKLHANSNLFNTATRQISARRAEVGFGWDWLQLYEGYGVALPLSISRRLNQSDLVDDTTLYQAAPELRFFLTESTDLSFLTELSRQQYLRGDENAEFLAEDEPTLEVDSRLAQLGLQIGRAPDVQNVQIHLSRSEQQQQSYRRQLQSLDSSAAELRYSHKLNENIAVVLDYAHRQQEQNQRDTALNQLGAGLAFAWTGNQQLELILGRFSRDYADMAERAEGSYWQLRNHWQWNRQWQLQLSSGRQSVLSYALDSVSQLDTRHQIKLLWTPLEQHQFNLALNYLRSSLDQKNYQRTRQSVALGWLWQPAQQWQLTLLAERVYQSSEQLATRSRHELSAGVRWSW